jgi:hypothetical protein
MRLVLDSPAFSLSQIWLLSCLKGHILGIKVEMKLGKNIFMKDQFLKLQLEDSYRGWGTAYEKNDFSSEQYVNDIAPVRLKDSKVSQVFLRPKHINSPALSFKSTIFSEANILGIYKSGSGQDSSVNLNFYRIVPRARALLSAGDYAYFEGEIDIGKCEDLKEPVFEDDVKLSGGSMDLAFDRGKCRIFWKGREITEGLSVYSSLRQGGVWYDSFQAVWRVVKKEDSYLEVCGDWPYIPVSQTWRISLPQDNTFKWEVRMDVYRPVNLEIMQANLMLVPGYKNWLLPQSGTACIFPEEYTKDYDIMPYRFWYGRPVSDGLTVTGKNLPRIQFICELKDQALRGVIENTDYLYRARLLQYQKPSARQLLPGEYHYFEGLIKIDAIR